MRNSCHFRILRYQETKLELGRLEFPDWLIPSFFTYYVVAFHDRDITYWFLVCKTITGFGHLENNIEMLCSLQPAWWPHWIILLLPIFSPPHFSPDLEKKSRSMFYVIFYSFPYVLQSFALVIPKNIPIRRWGEAIELILFYSSGSKGTERLSGLVELSSILMAEMYFNSWAPCLLLRLPDRILQRMFKHQRIFNVHD